MACFGDYTLKENVYFLVFENKVSIELTLGRAPSRVSPGKPGLFTFPSPPDQA